jgi:transposase
MNNEQRSKAKKQVIDLMQAGHTWQDATTLAEVQISRSTVYRWVHQFRTQGEAALYDGRHGHPSKAREPVLSFLESRYSQAPQTKSRIIQKELHEQFGLVISLTHLNRLRKANGRAYHAEKKNSSAQAPHPSPRG